MDASHVYVRALAQGSFYSLISTRTFLEGAGKRCSECALLLVPEPFWRAAHRVAGQLHGDKEYPFSGVTKSGRVWRKVPESDALSVRLTVAPSPAMVGLYCQARYNYHL